MHCTLIALALASCAVLSANALVELNDVKGWTWKGPLGPKNWAKAYPACAGPLQSPINIEWETNEACLEPLHIENLDWPQSNITIQNAYREAILILDRDYPIIVSGGPLPKEHVWWLGSICIHVGETDNSGSVHTIRGKSAAAEIQLVLTLEHLDERSWPQSESIVVLSWLIEPSPYDNPEWAPIIKALPDIRKAGSATQLAITSLKALLPQHEEWPQNYYSYLGSASVPPCNENVHNVVYRAPIALSSNQLAALRKICDEAGQPIINNARPIQRNNHRVIWRSIQ